MAFITDYFVRQSASDRVSTYKQFVCALLFAIFIAMSGTSLAWSATILTAELQTDGSVDPPGDAIRVKIQRELNGTGLSLGVRAYVVDPKSRQMLREIAKATDAPAPTPPTYLVQLTLPKNAELNVEEHSVVVPYSSLKLPPGTYVIGYVVSLVRGNAVISACPTRLTTCLVDDRTTERPVYRETKVATTVPVIVETSAYVIADEKIESKTMSVEVNRPVFEARTNEVNVKIPGGYTREDLKDLPETSWSLSDGSGEEKVAFKTEKPWIPNDSQTVWFATNRNVEDANERSANRFGNTASTELNRGKATVNIPVEVHRRGKLELPGTWWWSSRDPKKHFLLQRVTPLNQATFLDGIAASNRDTNHDVLIYVHGYNTTLEFACLRLAQIAYDIQFTGAPVAFSWPSRGVVSGYGDDEKAAAKSADKLAQLIMELGGAAQKHKDAKIHIIAHSMGNRVMLAALTVVKQKATKDQSRIGHVLMAAPDVAGTSFVANYPAVEQLADSVSLYFCGADEALNSSQILHMDSRIGQKAIFLQQLINIDAERANTSILGHGYYASESLLLVDIQAALEGVVPDKRHTIRAAKFTSPEIPVAHKYWQFP
jgi:esterase/lipase superfamily enzyme